MARTKTPAPHAARSAADTAPDPAPPPVTAPAAGTPAAAVLSALTANPGGATVAAIAGHAQITVAAARQALAAHEKAGTATRVKGGRPGIPDTWKPAALARPPSPALPTPGRPPRTTRSRTMSLCPPRPRPRTAPPPGSPPPRAPTARRTPSSPTPVPGDDARVGGEAEASTAQRPNPAVTAEAAATAQAVAQAAAEAGKALAAGDLPAALAALEAAREQAAQGRRVLKAAASGRRGPATRPGGLRDLVEQHLRQFPGRGLHPAPDRQGAHPVFRRGRQRPGQTGQPRRRRTGLRQAPQLPARPRTRPARRRPVSARATPSAA